MGFDGDFVFLGTSLKVFLIDLLLSGDNAVVIALACRTLPPRQMRMAVLIGTAAAIVLRVYLTTVVSYLLDVPFLKLIGAFALLVIGIKLMVAEDEHQLEQKVGNAAGFAPQTLEMWSAVILVVLADLVMSLDNVVALAAVAKGSIVFLALGLLLSIPLLMYGSLFVAALLKRYPILITAGGGLLGWIAGDIAVSDPSIADWVNTQAPALIAAMPVLGALFVLMESRIIENEPKRALAPAGHPALSGSVAVLAGKLGRKPANQSLPAATSPGAAPAASTHMPPSYGQPSYQEALAAGALVLVAEDNPLDQGALKRALIQMGCVVDVAVDGRRALDMLAERRYGLLITDLDMPEIDGYQLATRIRAAEQVSDRRLPIIGMVGYLGGDAITRKCIEAGMDACLQKPVAIDRLEAAVMAWLPVAAVLRQDPTTILEG